MELQASFLSSRKNKAKKLKWRYFVAYDE